MPRKSPLWVGGLSYRPQVMGLRPCRIGSFLRVGTEGPGVGRALGLCRESVLPAVAAVALSTSEFSRVPPVSPAAVETAPQGPSAPGGAQQAAGPARAAVPRRDVLAEPGAARAWLCCVGVCAAVCPREASRPGGPHLWGSQQDAGNAWTVPRVGVGVGRAAGVVTARPLLCHVPRAQSHLPAAHARPGSHF